MADFNGFDPVLAAELSEAAAQAGQQSDDAKKQSGTRRFKTKSSDQALTREQQRRQSDATQAAFIALGKGAAIAFLNGHDAVLGARPLDMAIESVDGLARVKAHLIHLKTRV